MKNMINDNENGLRIDYPINKPKKPKLKPTIILHDKKSN